MFQLDLPEVGAEEQLRLKLLEKLQVKMKLESCCGTSVVFDSMGRFQLPATGLDAQDMPPAGSNEPDTRHCFLGMFLVGLSYYHAEMNMTVTPELAAVVVVPELDEHRLCLCSLHEAGCQTTMTPLDKDFVLVAALEFGGPH